MHALVRILAVASALSCASPTQPKAVEPAPAAPANDALPPEPPRLTLADIVLDGLEEQHVQLNAGASVASRAIGSCDLPDGEGFEASLAVHIEDGRVGSIVFEGDVPASLKACVEGVVRATHYAPSASGTWRGKLVLR